MTILLMPFFYVILLWKLKKGTKLIHLSWLVSNSLLAVYTRDSLSFSFNSIFYLMLVSSG